MDKDNFIDFKIEEIKIWSMEKWGNFTHGDIETYFRHALESTYSRAYSQGLKRAVEVLPELKMPTEDQEEGLDYDEGFDQAISLAKKNLLEEIQNNE